MPRPESQAGHVALEECRIWLKWAAAQIEDCLTRDSHACGDLLCALGEVLGQERPKTAAAPAAAAGREMAAVVVAVQSHDRVMQGLAHVAESLHALHAQLGDGHLANSADAWAALRAARFRAFSMAQERALFADMVSHPGEAAHEAELTPEETVELFTGDLGVLEP